MAKKQNSVLPGFRLTLGYTLLYLSLIVIIPLAAVFVKSSELSWTEFWRAVFSPQALAAYRLSFGASFWPRPSTPYSGSSSLGCWCAIIFVAGECGRAGGSAVRAADRGRGHHPGDALRAERLDGPMARAARHQGFLHATRHIRRAHVHRSAVHCPHRAAGAGRSGFGTGGGRGEPGREPLADVLPGDFSAVKPGAADRFRARVRPRAGRIRFGRLHFQQHSDENADCSAAHHERTGRSFSTPRRPRWPP